MKFLNPNFLTIELIKEKEYIIINVNKNQQKIEKQIFKNINVKNRKEVELIFEKSKLTVDLSDTANCAENKIGGNIIIFGKEDKNKNQFIKIGIQQVISQNIDKNEKEYLGRISNSINKIKNLIK